MMLINYFAESLNCSKNHLQQQLACSENELMTRLQALMQQGIQFILSEDSVQLQPLLPLLNIEKIQQGLTPQRAYYQKVIHSTNQYLLENRQTLHKGDLCLTEFQSAGRGRRGKKWISPFAGQIILSLYWTLSPKQNLNGLSLVVGLAVAEVLADLGLEQVGLKWPNDILVEERKLAGILVEMAPRKNGPLQLVIGLGLNVAFPSQQLAVGQPYAQLQDYLPNIDRSDLIILLVQKISLYLLLFEKQGMPLFYSQWNRFDAFYGQEVSLIEQNTMINGIEKGIDSAGFLQIQRENHSNLEKFNIGDVSLRKKK